MMDQRAHLNRKLRFCLWDLPIRGRKLSAKPFYAILRYLTDPELRRTVQLQLNKGEYRQKLPRRIFFADQGEFTTGDYEEIMNKASCLSLVSNAILYWNTRKITDIVDNLKQHGAEIEMTPWRISPCCPSNM